jgi:hypothetical protein
LEKAVTTHAIIIPWPLSQGIRTWCGYDAQDERRIKDDMVASEPMQVDCERCRDAMRMAFANLSEWVPLMRSPHELDPDDESDVHQEPNT